MYELVPTKIELQNFFKKFFFNKYLFVNESFDSYLYI